MIIDTHCHLIYSEYDNIDEIIKKIDNNIIIISGYDDKSNREVVEIVNKYKNVYGTLGFHPSEYKKYNKDEFEFIKNNLANEKIVGIGEIGLDYHYGNENKKEQIKMFCDLLKLAEEKDVPVTIHTRDAAKDTLNELSKYNLKVIIHCFSYSYEVANEMIKKGYKLGIGGVLTFKNSKKIVEIVKNISLDDILLETDSPYLTPEPFRGHKNDPSYLVYVVKKISEIKNISLEEVAKITTNNALNIFNIKI